MHCQTDDVLFFYIGQSHWLNEKLDGVKDIFRSKNTASYGPFRFFTSTYRSAKRRSKNSSLCSLVGSLSSSSMVGGHYMTSRASSLTAFSLEQGSKTPSNGPSDDMVLYDLASYCFLESCLLRWADDSFDNVVHVLRVANMRGVVCPGAEQR